MAVKIERFFFPLLFRSYLILIFLVECVRFGVVMRKKKSNASEGVYQQQNLTPFK